MTMEMQEQASIGWLSIDLSFKFCSILDNFNADTFFNVSLYTKIRQLASIFMKRMVGAIV